jgi:N-carbamoylputrescine amidase
MHITIALLQMTSFGNDQRANLSKGEAFCRRACDMGADIALFPEMWNIGYTPYLPKEQEVCDLWRAPEQWQDGAISGYPALQSAREQWQAQAITKDSQFITHYRELAKELQMAIAITYLEHWPGAPRNTVPLIDRHGEIILTYAKVHTCDFGAMEAACTPGNNFYVCKLDTRQGAVKIGAMICFDREFPESARILMLINYL